MLNRSEKKHKKQLKRNERNRKLRAYIELLGIDVSEPVIYHPHPIQKTKKKSIFSIWRRMDRPSKYKNIELEPIEVVDASQFFKK